MRTNSPVRSEASFLHHTASLCREMKTGHDGAWQIAPFQCSIPYQERCLQQVEALKDRLRRQFPALIEFGEKRAKKAYRSTAGTITKPSYISRIINFDGKGLNQLESIRTVAGREPSSGGLVFSVFTPSDLADRKRPGYVPCLVAGSLMLHEGELQLNAFFRSQSVVEFGIFDLEFLRTLQMETVALLNCQRTSKNPIEVGSLNLQFGRIIVQRRFMRNRQGFARREEILDDWIRLVEDFCLETEYL